MSLRMAPDACTATPRAPHGWLHVQDTCRTPPLLPDVRLHDWSSCKAPHITHMAGRMLWLHARRHLVLGRSTSCFYMSSCMCSFHARRHLELLLTFSWLNSCHHVLIPSDQATSSFSVPLRDLDPSCEFLTRDQSRIFFRSHSDSLNIFNKLQMMSDFL